MINTAHSLTIHYIVKSTVDYVRKWVETSVDTYTIFVFYCHHINLVFWSGCLEQETIMNSPDEVFLSSVLFQSSFSPLLLQSLKPFLSPQCMLGTCSVSRLGRCDVNLSVFTGAFPWTEPEQDRCWCWPEKV